MSVYFLIMLKNLLDLFEIDILNIELYRVHQECRHKNVNSPYPRLYLITSGQGYTTHHNRKYHLQPGNMYLIPLFTTVDLYCPKSFCHYYIRFTTRLPNGLDLFSVIECSYQAEAAEHGIKRTIFDRLIDLNPGRELIERDANKPIYKSVLDRCISLDQKKSVAEIMESNALMRLLLSAFLKTAHPLGTPNSMMAMNKFQHVIEYIHEHLDSYISLPQLAELAGLHPTYFSNVFTKLMGISPIQYINRKRIEKAQTLLLSTEKSLEEIARQVGFTDVFYFPRVFKKTAGLPPATYRNRLLFA